MQKDIPIDGKDGYIKYNFEIEKRLMPKILEDGTVDYRELDVINNVNSRRSISRINTPKGRESGYRVTGEIIPYKKGKTPLLKYGKMLRLLDNGRLLVAEKDGLVALKGKGNSSEMFKVDNVDSKIGNIYFDGTVISKRKCFKWISNQSRWGCTSKRCSGRRYIENTGDVIIKKGIQGYNKLVVQTKGNITTKFVENAIIILWKYNR